MKKSKLVERIKNPFGMDFECYKSLTENEIESFGKYYVASFKGEIFESKGDTLDELKTNLYKELANKTQIEITQTQNKLETLTNQLEYYQNLQSKTKEVGK